MYLAFVSSSTLQKRFDEFDEMSEKSSFSNKVTMMDK